MDTQSVEIIGRNWLVTQLVRDGVEVARPERDHGIDLIAYLDIDETHGSFVACPVQMKAASDRRFELKEKYNRFTHLMLVYVWYVHDLEKVCAYAFSIGEALEVVGEMLGKNPWGNDLGNFLRTRPSKALRKRMEPHLMKPGDWKEKIRTVGTGGTYGQLC